MWGITTASPRRRGLAALLAAITAVVLGLLLVVPPPASASAPVDAQLSLSGIATPDNPAGGSKLGVHPGDSVVFSAASVPTAGLDKLGLGKLLTGVAGLLASYQVKVDFSGLPGGAKNTVLKGKGTKTFSFPRAGTYNFTWQAQSVGLLGVVPINLDGNQLAKAGIKLNAQNQYVGQVVVATNPPKGGIGIQLPGVSVQPELPIVGKLPKISLPGVTTPTIPVSVPDLNPTTKSTGKTKSTAKPKTTSGAAGALPVPAMVVPQGSGKVIGDIGNFQGAIVGDGPISSSGQSVAPAAPGATSDIAATGKSATPSITANSSGKGKTIDLASNSPASSGLPAVLAMIAVLALVLVAGAYARLFLIRKHP